MFGSDAPDWREDGRDWPNRDHSRFVQAAGLRWHVQVAGSGPVLLLIHGTGAATHSWRGLLPLLTDAFTVVAPDLPGHGFTTRPPSARMTLPGMARALDGLLDALAVRPALAVGHSAGAAILARLCLDGRIDPAALVSLNGAFLPFREGQGRLFSGLAKMLVINPLVPRVFSWTAGDRRSVEKLIRDTGSTIDPAGVGLYTRLLRRPDHVAGALSMMASWDLDALLADLPRLKPDLFLVAAGNDRAVPPSQAARVAALVPGARIVPQPGLGHLSHEERPADTAAIIRGVAADRGLIPAVAP